MQTLLLYTAFCAPILPIFIGVWSFQRLMVVQKMLFWMTVLVFFNQFLSLIWTHFLDQPNNMPFFNIYIVIEFSFLSLIYQQLINNQTFWKLSNVFILLFGVVWIIHFFWGNRKWEYPSYLLFAESLIVLFYTAKYFLKTFKEGIVMNLLAVSGFWISFGLILYFASNTLLFLFGEFVLQLSDESFKLIWTIHGILTIFLYVTYAIALRCK